jgi:hypothetical protein
MWDILGDDYVVDEQFTNDGNEIVIIHMNVTSSYMIFQKTFIIAKCCLSICQMFKLHNLNKQWKTS